MRVAPLIALLLCACSWSRDLEIGLPELPPETESVVISMEHPSEHRVFAFPRDGLVLDAPVVFAEGEQGLLQVVGYDRPLAEMGLAAGEQMLTRDPPSQGLPRSEQTFSAAWNGTRLQDWEVSAASPLLSDFRVADSSIDPCTEFVSIPLPWETRARRVTPLDEHHALLIEDVPAGSLYIIDVSNPDAPRLTLLEEDARVEDAFTDRHGNVWTVEYPNVVVRNQFSQGRLIRGESFAVPTPVAVTAFAMTVEETWAGAAVDDDGRVFAFDHDRFTEIDQFDCGSNSCEEHVDVVHPLRGETIILYDRNSELYGLNRDGGSTTMTRTVTNRPTAMVEHPQLGLFVTQNAGGLLLSRTKSIDDLTEVASLTIGSGSLKPQALTPYRDGVVWAGDTGFVGQYRDSGSLCTAQQLVDGPVTQLVGVGRNILAINENDSLPRFVLLRAQDTKPDSPALTYAAVDDFSPLPDDSSPWSYHGEDGIDLERGVPEELPCFPTPVLFGTQPEPIDDNFWILVGQRHMLTSRTLGSIRRWRAPTSGFFEIGGMIADSCRRPLDVSDGAAFTIRQGGTTLFHRFLPADAPSAIEGSCDCSGPPRSIELTADGRIARGETLDFIFYSGGKSNSSDKAVTEPVIRFFPD